MSTEWGQNWVKFGPRSYWMPPYPMSDVLTVLVSTFMINWKKGRYLKFRYPEKAKKIWPIFHFLKLLLFISHTKVFFSESAMRFSNLRNKYSKSLSWALNLNKLFTGMGRKFKFQVQDSDLEYEIRDTWIFNLFVTSTKRNHKITNSPIHELNVLQKGLRACPF